MDAALQRYLELLLWRALPSLLVIARRRLVDGSRRALAPLTALAAAARDVDVGTLRPASPHAGHGDQLDDVATAFNETLASLDDAVGEMRQFSSALAHELRTPLAALRGEIELALLHGRRRVRAADRAASQIEEIDKLTRMVNQLLTLARAESGRDSAGARSGRPRRARPRPSRSSSSRWRKPRTSTCSASSISAVTVTGDTGWLERLLLNLLDNAIKYTASGGQSALAYRARQVGPEWTCPTRGSGIPADAVPHIFERFYRVDPARSSTVEGAGLGLSLAKWIVERHHGRIDVQSEPGKGSTFTIWLPRRPSLTPINLPFTFSSGR